MSMIQQTRRTVLSVPAAATDVLTQHDDNRDAGVYVESTAVAWYFGEQRVRLTADITGSTSTTPTDVTGLVFPVVANLRYNFKFCLLYTSATATTGLKIGLTCPAGFVVISASVNIFGRVAEGTGTAWQGHILASGGVVTSDAVLATGTTYPAYVEGVLVNGANAGNLQLQWAAEVGSAGAVAPKQGSWGRLWMQ